MHTVSKWFVIASLSYLLLGSALGVTFFFIPQLMVLKPVHMHLNLLGFMCMMIYGVLYHVLPRFLGTPLYSYKWAYVHLYLANIALILMMSTMALYYTSGQAVWFQASGWFGGLQFLSMVIFAGNIFITMHRSAKPRILQ